MKTITLIGSFGATNIGDEAILESTLQYLKKHDPSSKIMVMTHDVKETQMRYRDYNVEAIPNVPFGFRSLLFNGLSFIKNLHNVKKTDLVLFPGGGLFTEKESIYALLLWWTHFIFFHKILGKKIILVGQSFDEVNTILGKWCFRYVLINAQSIYIRDQLSYNYIEKNTPNPKNIHRMLDPVCYITPKDIPSKTHKSEEIHIAISLRPWKKNQYHLLEIVKDSILLYMKKNPTQSVKVHLVPMQYKGSEDVSILQELGHLLYKNSIGSILHTPQSYSDVLEILSSCTMAIGMRLHFLILSAKAKLPFFAIIYSDKVQGFLDEVGIKESLPLSSIDDVTLSKETIVDFLENYTDQEIYLDVFEKKSEHEKKQFLKHIHTELYNQFLTLKA